MWHPNPHLFLIHLLYKMCKEGEDYETHAQINFLINSNKDHNCRCKKVVWYVCQFGSRTAEQEYIMFDTRSTKMYRKTNRKFIEFLNWISYPFFKTEDKEREKVIFSFQCIRKTYFSSQIKITFFTKYLKRLLSNALTRIINLIDP